MNRVRQSFSIEKSPRPEPLVDGEDGFALPFVLAALLVLSLSVAVMVERVLDAQTLARSQRQALTTRIERAALETDLVWRALVEAHGVAPTFEGVRDGAPTYLVRPPNGNWRRRGETAPWTPSYDDVWRRLTLEARTSDLPPDDGEDSGTDAPPGVSVSVRDTRGLIDLNYVDLRYLAFVADRLGVPARRQPTAARALASYVRARRGDEEDPGRIGAVSTGELGLSLYAGLVDPAEICGLADWSEIELCRDPGRLRQLAFGGNGLAPNIYVSPPDVRALLLGQPAPDDPLRLEMLWERIQTEAGFYDNFQNLGDGRGLYVVTFTHANGWRSDALLDVRLQADGRPYRFTRYPVLDISSTRELGEPRVR